MRAGLAVAGGTWKALTDSGAGASQCGCGAVGPVSLMVPILPLLVSSLLLLIPGLAPTQASPGWLPSDGGAETLSPSSWGLGWLQVPAGPHSWARGHQVLD